VWLAIELSIVALGIILVVVAGFSVWRRWQRMRRSGERFSRRVGSLTASANVIAERLQTSERGASED
jgi:type VI protein secretion system component VasK